MHGIHQWPIRVTQSVLPAPPTFAEAKDPGPHNAVDKMGKSLEMRLSDAGMRCRGTKLIYLNHRPSPWPTEDAPHDRSKQLLEFGATPSSQMPCLSLPQE